MRFRVLRWLGFRERREPPQPEATAPPPELPAEPPPATTPPLSQPRVVATGSQISREIEVVIGIDFGTSCTKIAARLPYETGQPTYALPVPPERQAESHPYLWLSELWLAPDGAFSLHPVPDGSRLTQLKRDLIEPPELSAIPGPRPSAIEAAASFLVLQIRRARSWVAQNRHRFAGSGDSLRWSWHIGFPAGSLGDSPRRRRYETCLAVAFDLATDAEPLRLAQIREATERVSGNPGAILQNAGAALFPEVAAAVADFAYSPRHENGLYAMIDVGAGTFDCCTFNLVHLPDGTTTCPIFAADVQLLGVEPWRACEGDPEAEAAFRHSLDVCARTVIWQTRTRGYPSSDRWAEGLPLFLVGGGKYSRTHRECAEALTPWIRENLGADRYPYPYLNAGVPIVAPPAPALIECACNESQSRRLIVAVGLSLPADWIPAV